METHINSLAVADIEADFTSGAADEELSGFLSSLQQEADALLIDGRGPAAEAAAASLEAAAAEMLETGDVPEAEVRSSLFCIYSASWSNTEHTMGWVYPH